MEGPITGNRNASSSRPKQHATDTQNAAAVAAGAAALGAVIGLAVSTGPMAPIAGAIVASVIGAAGGHQANNVVRWWQRSSHHTAANNPSIH